eukprot:5154804-Pleurochrysis_carterae.AAC.1
MGMHGLQGFALTSDCVESHASAPHRRPRGRLPIATVRRSVCACAILRARHACSCMGLCAGPCPSPTRRVSECERPPRAPCAPHACGLGTARVSARVACARTWKLGGG